MKNKFFTQEVLPFSANNKAEIWLRQTGQNFRPSEKAIYKDNMDTILDNCDSYLFLGGSSKTTLKDLVEKLGKETINLYNTSENRGREKTSGLSYQTLGRSLMELDEIAVMPRDECILQISGVRPFHSKKYDITKHTDYKYLSDYSKRNTFDIGRFLDTRAKLKIRETCDVYEVDAESVP